MNKFFITFILLISNSIIAQKVEPFSESFDSFQNLRDFCISQNNDEAFFTIQSPNQDLSQIAFILKINGKWSQPTLLPFCDEYMYLEPFLSLDGRRLYFVSDRPLTDSMKERKDFDIWYVQRNGVQDKWSEPINIGSNVNSKSDEFYPTLSENNNLYFTMESSLGLGKDDIYYCQWNGKEYSKPQLLNEHVNSSGYEFNAFISKDESFLIFTKYNTPDGFGSGDLFISRKDEKGEWQPAENLGNTINTKYMEYCPFYDDKNETLYFTSRRSNLVSKKFNDLLAFQAYIFSGENGLSKIYKYKIKLK